MDTLHARTLQVLKVSKLLAGILLGEFFCFSEHIFTTSKIH